MASSSVISLSTTQRRRLQVLIRAPDTTPRVRLRATILLLSARGTGGEEIAQTLGVTRRTVSNTRTRWREGGLRGLDDRPHPGRPPRADAAYRALLRHAVERDPRKFGYAFTRWTAPRLAAHLAGRTGVSLSAARVAEVLRDENFVWRRTRHTLRNLQDPDEIQRAHRKLLRLKRGVSRPARSSSSGTATA